MVLSWSDSDPEDQEAAIAAFPDLFGAGHPPPTRFPINVFWVHMRWFDYGHYISLHGLPLGAVIRISAFLRPVVPQRAIFGARSDALSICSLTRRTFVRSGHLTPPHGRTRLLVEAYWCRFAAGLAISSDIVQISRPDIMHTACGVLLGALALFFRPILDYVPPTSIHQAVGLSASTRFAYLSATNAIEARKVHECILLSLAPSASASMPIYVGLNFSPSGRYLVIHGLLDASCVIAKFLEDMPSTVAFQGTLFVAFRTRFSLDVPHHGWAGVYPWPRWQPVFIDILPRDERNAHKWSLLAKRLALKAEEQPVSNVNLHNDDRIDGSYAHRWYSMALRLALLEVD